MLFSRSQEDPNLSGSRMGRLLPLLSLILVLVGLTLISGCGGGSDDDNKDVVLALVGDHEVTGEYYEFKLTRMEESELPKGEDGLPLDMSTNEGKNEFLTTLINKELMATKAEQLGYGSDAQVVGLRESMTSYEGGLALWSAVVGEPAGTISPEELEAFYARMGEVRECNYLMTNFREEAEEARQMSLDGADWDDVVAKYHRGGVAPDGLYEISIPFGRYNMDFDASVFDTEPGGVTPPILTNYGFWVMKVNAIVDKGKPDLEEAKAGILDTFHNRKTSRLRKEFMEDVREKYEFFINEDVLWTCYQGLPEGETMMDPATNKPMAKENLVPLSVDPADMDGVFYGYRMGGELKEYTLGDYKTHYDRMSVFQRPKHAEMLGGLRQKITTELDKALVNREAMERGFFEDPLVVSKVQDKVEEVMVTKLFDDVVAYDKIVSPEALDAFWKEHEKEYINPETRSGRMIICRNEETAFTVIEKIEEGMKWKDLLTRFGTDKDNKSRTGKLDNIYVNTAGPVSETMFTMEAGQISDPIALEDGRFAVARLESITPSYQKKFEDVTETVGQRIRMIRQEEAFQALLAKWAEEIGVTRYEENLAEVDSWEELTAVQLEGELIPRN